jgi:hypothetical protein
MMSEAPPPGIPSWKQKFIELATKHETDIRQIQAALLLHNIRFYVVLVALFYGFSVLSLVLTEFFISPVTYALAFYPVISLLSVLIPRKLAGLLYLRALPDLDAADPRRLRSIDELADLVGYPMQILTPVASWIRETLVRPAPVETSMLILGTVLLGFVFKVISPFVILLIVGTAALTAPALFTRTNFAETIKRRVHKLKAQNAGQE